MIVVYWLDYSIPLSRQACVETLSLQGEVSVITGRDAWALAVSVWKKYGIESDVLHADRRWIADVVRCELMAQHEDSWWFDADVILHERLSVVEDYPNHPALDKPGECYNNAVIWSGRGNREWFETCITRWAREPAYHRPTTMYSHMDWKLKTYGGNRIVGRYIHCNMTETFLKRRGYGRSLRVAVV